MPIHANCPGQVQKCLFVTFKMAVISRSQGHLRSYFRTRCLVPLTMSLPHLVGITNIYIWREVEKCGFFSMKDSRHFVKSCVIRPKSCTPIQDHIRYVYAKYHWNLCNNEGSIAVTNIPAHILDPAVVAVASNPSKTYKSLTSCGTYMFFIKIQTEMVLKTTYCF